MDRLSEVNKSLIENWKLDELHEDDERNGLSSSQADVIGRNNVSLDLIGISSLLRAEILHFDLYFAPLDTAVSIGILRSVPVYFP
jgi:hypothetical protein